MMKCVRLAEQAGDENVTYAVGNNIIAVGINNILLLLFPSIVGRFKLVTRSE